MTKRAGSREDKRSLSLWWSARDSERTACRVSATSPVQTTGPELCLPSHLASPIFFFKGQDLFLAQNLLLGKAG